MARDLKICLSVETTGPYLGLGLYSFGEPIKTLGVTYEEVKNQHSELLIPALTALLKRSGVRRNDVSMIAVDAGPGSFTGVRVGLACARTLAQQWDVALVAVSGLEAMAWRASQTNPRGVVVARVPALAGEVYFAAYRGGKTVAAPCWDKESALTSFLTKQTDAIVTERPPHPDDVARVAIDRYRRTPSKRAFFYENAHPLYLQPSWAERTKAARSAK